MVQKISDNTGIDRGTVLNIVESFMLEVKGSLQKGEEVTLRGFGGFFLKHRAEKTARNITKNTTIIVPAHDLPSFKPAKDFLESIGKN